MYLMTNQLKYPLSSSLLINSNSRGSASKFQDDLT